MRIVAKTDKGHVRNSNQDAYAVGEFSDEVVWAVVCDGMGGANGGNIASALAVKVISDRINVSYREQMRDSSIINMLDSALNAANVEVFDLAQSKTELNGMGTTVVCAIVKMGKCLLHMSVTVELIYLKMVILLSLLRTTVWCKICLTAVKSLLNKRWHHPNKNIITRAVGVDKNIDIDFDETELDDESTLLLCTDGLSNYVSNDEILELTSDGKHYAFADRLVNKANRKMAAGTISPQ